MRLEGMAGLRYNVDDPEGSDVDLRSRVVRITATGRRELVLPICTKVARDIDRHIRLRAGHPRGADAWLWLGTKGRLTASGVYQMIKDGGPRSGSPICTRTSYGTRSRITGWRTAGLRVT
jgi:site-specific recombinase XerC